MLRVRLAKGRARSRATNVISKYIRLSARHTTYNFPMAAYLLCALTIPRSKCTLMDCIKQRDGRAGKGEGRSGGGKLGGRARPSGRFQRDARRRAPPVERILFREIAMIFNTLSHARRSINPKQSVARLPQHFIDKYSLVMDDAI